MRDAVFWLGRHRDRHQAGPLYLVALSMLAILGACGSSTSAVIRTAGLTGCQQAMVFGETGARVVGITPGADWSASSVGRGVADGADDVAVAADSPATGTPSLVRAHAARTQASASAAHPARFISPWRRRARILVPDPRKACPRHLRSPMRWCHL